MNIVVVGLGIIGGSYCKAIKKYTSHFVIGIDNDEKTLISALRSGAIDEGGNELSLSKADLVIISLYPKQAINYLRENAKYINPKAIVTDTAGIKIALVKEFKEISNQYGFTFIGSHPMAGKETNGFVSSDSDLFIGASFIIVPVDSKKEHISFLSNFAYKIGFSTVKITTPTKHDEMIAYTSQLPHVLACAYVLNDKCKDHRGFSAGSYKDVSRVANINSKLWSELFLENSDILSDEIETLINSLKELKQSIDEDDQSKLESLLDQGKKNKEIYG